jgi:hypothetical protein
MDKKTDYKTKKQLFNEIAKNMAFIVIKALYQGQLSDPPGISWYTPILTTDHGKAKIDKDGLHLWRGSWLRNVSGFLSVSIICRIVGVLQLTCFVDPLDW